MVGSVADRRTLLRAALRGRLWRDSRGYVWRQVGQAPKVRVAERMVTSMADLLERDGDKYRLTEAGKAELQRLEDR